MTRFVDNLNAPRGPDARDTHGRDGNPKRDTSRLGTPAHATPSRATRGFTLIELLVVIAIIALAMGMVLPSAIRLFTTGAERQARSIMSAMLAGARSLAIEKQTYTLVHVQMGKDKRCWAVIMRLDPKIRDNVTSSFRTFVPMEGIAPRQLPKDVGIGKIDEFWVQPDSTLYRSRFLTIRGDADESGSNPAEMTRRQMRCFSDFNVIFTPDGSAAKSVNGMPPLLSNRIYPCDDTGKYDLGGRYVRLYGPTPVDFSNLPAGASIPPPAILWEGWKDNLGNGQLIGKFHNRFVAAVDDNGAVMYCPSMATTDRDWFALRNANGVLIGNGSNIYASAVFAGDRTIPVAGNPNPVLLDGGYGVLSMITFSYSTLSVLNPPALDTTNASLNYSLLGQTPPDIGGFATNDNEYLLDGKTNGTPVGNVAGAAVTRAYYLTNPGDPGTRLFIAVNPYTGRLTQE